MKKKHHRYEEEKTPEIRPYLEKIVQVHGAQHPELFEVKQLFEESAQDLAAHMKKEELVLFPNIRKMVSEKQRYVQLFFGSIQNPITAMQVDHNQEGERFRKIAELTNEYTPPADTCNTYKVTLSLLQEFETDLHTHIHLENNILFPKAIDLEKSLQ